MEDHSLTTSGVLTGRNDFWWLLPLLMLLGGGLAVLYLTWAALQNGFYEWGPYTSPIYAAPYVPSWWKISPAFLLLWIPIGFRLTCYYGRRAYYRAFLADPAACAVEEPYRQNYRGETKIPFIWNNIHRYFFYLAFILLIIHWIELILGLFYQGKFYFGVGTLILLIDTLALSFYVLGCHSFRHLIGGGKRCFSCSGCEKIGIVKHKIWKKVSILNAFHGKWFWISLFSICLADIYIRLLAMGVGQDFHITF